MAYIGLQPQTKVLATSTQKLNGTGGDFEYALNRAVSKAADLRVFVGNVAMRPEIDYTASGTQILFTSQPAVGIDNININYVAGALTAITLSSNSFPQGSTVNPSIRYSDGPSTGIHFPSTTSVGITTSGNTRVTVTNDPAAVDAQTGALRVTGGVGITQKLIVGDDVSFLSTTTSVDSTSGALIVNGGVGVGENLSVGGTLSVAGDFVVAGSFTTTSADSLVLNDPFLFLANANPGDALDTGVVSSYNDGITRFTGLFRDITDGKYKLFDNLDVSPTTTVDTGDTSFEFSDLKLGILEVNDATESSSTTSGALIVTGGIGVAKNLYIGGGIGANGSLGSNGQFLSSTGTGLTWTTLSAQRINQDASNVTVTANYVNVAVNGGNVFSFGASRLSTATYFNTTANISTPQLNAGGGVLNSLTVNGNVTVTTAYVMPSANAASSLGSSAARWNFIYGVNGNFLSVNANYADLAEKYLADADYEPGTVLHFGGSAEVSQCDVDMCSRVAGVVSTQPAYLMNDTIQGEHIVSLALLGRVPTKVVGPIKKGDMLVSAGDGRARAEHIPQMGTVIGKALEDFNGDRGVIEVVVGRV